MTSTTLPTVARSRRIPLGWAASILTLGGVVVTAVALSGGGGSAATPAAVASAPEPAVFGSADAAEHWLSADIVAVEVVASADALERRADAELDHLLASCRTGSVDAVERCVQHR